VSRRGGGPAAGGNRVTWLHNTSRHVGVTDKYGFFSPLFYPPCHRPCHTNARGYTPRILQKFTNHEDDYTLPMPTDHTKHNNILYSYNIPTMQYAHDCRHPATPLSLQGLFHPTAIYIISLVHYLTTAGHATDAVIVVATANLVAATAALVVVTAADAVALRLHYDIIIVLDRVS